MEEALKLFVLGITVSFGPCIAQCSLAILPYIAATTQSWKGGLRAILIFAAARLAVYGALGLLAGLLGRTLIEQLLRFELPIMVAGGTLVAGLGIYTFFRKNEASHCRVAACGSARHATIGGSALLGLFAGIVPCLPLLGVLAFTALHARDPWQGACYGLAFGAGKFFSPLILLGALAGSASAFLLRHGRVFSCFTRVCGVVLVFIGIHLIVHGVFPQRRQRFTGERAAAICGTRSICRIHFARGYNGGVAGRRPEDGGQRIPGMWK